MRTPLLPAGLGHTCTKRFNDVAFMHRVFLKDGSPSHIHGHIWAFEFEFASAQLDVNGFVVDFTRLGEIEAAINLLRDGVVLSEFDPAVNTLSYCKDLCRTVLVPDASVEGLARYLFNIANQLAEGRGAQCVRCTAFEDNTNSATYHQATPCPI